MEKTQVFTVGELVQFRFGVRTVQGTVKEDRGPIGVKGRRLYLVRFTPEMSSEFSIELPAEEMERVSDAVSSS